MSSLKDALMRVTRVARHLELRQPRKTLNYSGSVTSQLGQQDHQHTQNPQFNLLPERKRIPSEQLKKIRPYLKGFQKKRYQKFLEPLEMPELKIYDESTPTYDVARAEANLASKKSKDRIDVFNNFLSERFVFNKMLDFLVELTPPHLKSEETVNDPASLASVLAEQDQQYTQAKGDDVPRFHFHEIPPIPLPLTKDTFRQYIYSLTHLRMLYKNSSSLASGIVPEILFFTHSLDNETFKPYRSVDTYNYLIKYFGYDKFQSSFAKELLLVMAKDGHRPNLELINQLLKICRIHSNRRFLVSTYRVIINYLNLVKRMDLQVNLTTWNRVYDCIDNIFLKEIFLNKMSTANLPILNNMCIRILEDFATTTTHNHEVVTFVEQDLRRPNWKSDPRLLNKVLYHRVSHLKKNSDLKEIWHDMLLETQIDAMTLKTFVNAISSNPNLANKEYLLLATYMKMRNQIAFVPEVLGKLILAICNHQCEILTTSKLVRALIHKEAVERLNLQVEFNEYATGLDRSESPTKKLYPFPYPVPRANIPEHYKMMKRLTQYQLIDLEAITIYFQNESERKELRMPWELLDDAESAEWSKISHSLETDPEYWENTESKSTLLGLNKTAQTTPPEVVATYRTINTISMGVSHDINLIHKLEVGLDKQTEQEMAQRKIYLSPK